MNVLPGIGENQTFRWCKKVVNDYNDTGRFYMETKKSYRIEKDYENL